MGDNLSDSGVEVDEDRPDFGLAVHLSGERLVLNDRNTMFTSASPHSERGGINTLGDHHGREIGLWLIAKCDGDVGGVRDDDGRFGDVSESSAVGELSHLLPTVSLEERVTLLLFVLVPDFLERHLRVLGETSARKGVVQSRDDREGDTTVETDPDGDLADGEIPTPISAEARTLNMGMASMTTWPTTQPRAVSFSNCLSSSMPLSFPGTIFLSLGSGLNRSGLMASKESLNRPFV